VDFDIPEKLETENFRLRILTPEDAAKGLTGHHNNTLLQRT
jgi:hypothetical protein